MKAEKYIHNIDFNSKKFISIDPKITNSFKPIHSLVMSFNEDKILEMESRLKNNCTIIVGKKFTNYSHKDKMLAILKNHVACIRYAKKLELDHVFIFEDDVIFIDNWTNIVNEFINLNKVDIIRFDRLPFNIIENSPDNNKVYFYKTAMQCALGGYYLSKFAVNTMLVRYDQLLKILEEDKSDYGTETLWGYLAKPFEDEIYTSCPRICIQDWINQKVSSLQSDDHLNSLSDMQEKYYLPKYGHFYPELTNEKNN